MVGEAEADNMLSLRKTDRKAVIRELLVRRRESHYIENYVVRADENLVSGDQNKEIIKDERAAHWRRGHSLQQRHYAQTSIESRRDGMEMKCLAGMKVSKPSQG